MQSVMKWLKDNEVHMVKLKSSHEEQMLYEKMEFQSSRDMEKFI